MYYVAGWKQRILPSSLYGRPRPSLCGYFVLPVSGNPTGGGFASSYTAFSAFGAGAAGGNAFNFDTSARSATSSVVRATICCSSSSFVVRAITPPSVNNTNVVASAASAALPSVPYGPTHQRHRGFPPCATCPQSTTDAPRVARSRQQLRHSGPQRLALLRS